MTFGIVLCRIRRKSVTFLREKKLSYVTQCGKYDYRCAMEFSISRMANDSFRCRIINDALVCVHSGEKNFIPQYCQKKGFIGGADMQPAQATKNESREHWSQSGMFIRVIFQHVHTITHRLAFNCTEKNRPRIFKETNYLFEIMNIFVYIKIALELKYQLRM